MISVTNLTQKLPFFSVIVPTYNRPDKLRNCLNALTKLEYPIDRFEVVIVDDGSSESVEPVADLFRQRFSLFLDKQPNAGPAAARNRGASHSKGEYLVYTDDDCTPDSKWLLAFAKRFASFPDHLIGGLMINLISENVYSEASQQLISYLYDYYNGGLGRNPFFASSNLALPARLFHEVGGFNTNFPLAAGEDREFCDRWLFHGHQMTYAPEAVAFHSHALTFRRFCRQHYNYGRGAFRFHQIHAQRNAKHIELEPFSFYYNLLRYPFSKAKTIPAMMLALLMVLSQAANAAGFFFEKLSPSREKEK